MMIKGTEKSSNVSWNAAALQGRYVDYNAVCSDDEISTLSAMITIKTKISRPNFYDRRVNHYVTKNKLIAISNTFKF